MFDPNRLSSIGDMYKILSPHIVEGTRIRTGMEGDPCNTTHDAMCGTVEDVRRDGEKIVFSFRGDDGSMRTLNNFSVDPEDCWEIEPNYLDTFRGIACATVNDSIEIQSDFNNNTMATNELQDTIHALKQSLENLELKFRAAEETNEKFRSLMASTVREIAGDIGNGGKFSSTYAQHYDEQDNRYTRHDWDSLKDDVSENGALLSINEV